VGNPPADSAGGTGDPEQGLRSHGHAGEVVLPGRSATFAWEHPLELGVCKRPQQLLGLGFGGRRVSLDHALDKAGIPQVVAHEPAADAMETHAVTLGQRDRRP
jgi:hypothetical protein